MVCVCSISPEDAGGCKDWSRSSPTTRSARQKTVKCRSGNEPAFWYASRPVYSVGAILVLKRFRAVHFYRFCKAYISCIWRRSEDWCEEPAPLEDWTTDTAGPNSHITSIKIKERCTTMVSKVCYWRNNGR